MDMFGTSHLEQALSALVNDLGARGVTVTKLEVVSALVQLQRSGALECDLHGPLYLVPFTICQGMPAGQLDRRLRCMGTVLVIDEHEKLNRSVCQYKCGQHELHPPAMVQISVVCTGTVL